MYIVCTSSNNNTKIEHLILWFGHIFPNAKLNPWHDNLYHELCPSSRDTDKGATSLLMIISPEFVDFFLVKSAFEVANLSAFRIVNQVIFSIINQRDCFMCQNTRQFEQHKIASESYHCWLFSTVFKHFCVMINLTIVSFNIHSHCIHCQSNEHYLDQIIKYICNIIFSWALVANLICQCENCHGQYHHHIIAFNVFFTFTVNLSVKLCFTNLSMWFNNTICQELIWKRDTYYNGMFNTACNTKGVTIFTSRILYIHQMILNDIDESQNNEQDHE